MHRGSRRRKTDRWVGRSESERNEWSEILRDDEMFPQVTWD